LTGVVPGVALAYERPETDAVETLDGRKNSIVSVER
jgi:hypothetical protein